MEPLASEILEEKQKKAQGQSMLISITEGVNTDQRELTVKDKSTLIMQLEKTINQTQKMIEIVQTSVNIEKPLHTARVSKDELISSLQEIRNEFIQIKKTCENEEVNINLLGLVITFINEILSHMQVQKLETVDKALLILEFQVKLSSSLSFITHSLKAPDDIAITPKHEKYKKTWEKIKIDLLGNPQKLKQKFKSLKKMLAITTSAVLSEESKELGISKIFTYGLSYPKYLISDKNGQLKAMRFYRNPTVHLAKKIWNLPQNGMTREMVKLKLKSITTNKKIYIPIEPNAEPDSIYTENRQSIQVRVLHHEEMRFTDKREKKISSGFSCFCSSDSKEYENITTVILHMHGGGFIALSSRSMQTYTRRWAKKLKIPVFSVDYRMPPQHRFPTAPYDCLRVYDFLLNHIHKYMNVKPKKIILTGDSAGGNLAFALNVLIMKNKLPPPHGIYTAYPALDVRKMFSPAKVHAFTDPLLYPSMLLLCLSEYIGENQQTQKDPLASPLLVTRDYIGSEKGSEQFPENWPKTRIQVGAKDPLYDDSIRMMQRLVNAGVDCECQVYENLSHGFLNLDFVVEECQKTITDSIDHLKALL